MTVEVLNDKKNGLVVDWNRTEIEGCGILGCRPIHNFQ